MRIPKFFKGRSENTDSNPSPAPKPTSNPTPSGPTPEDMMKKLPALLAILFALAAGTASYLYTEVRELKRNPNQAALEESQELLAAVGRLIVLPDEQPTIATVADPSKLKDQQFFASAKVGDKVLIYTNAKKAILYDPVADKIKEVAPVNIGNNADASQVSGASTETKK